MNRRGARWVAWGLKLAITLALLGVLLQRIDLGPVLARISAMMPAAASAAAAVLAFQLVLMAWRWRLVNRVAGVPAPFATVLRLTAIGHFVNQVLPSGFAGDAARAWLGVREGLALGPVVRAIVCDRVVGLLVLVLLVAAALLAAPVIDAVSLPDQGVLNAVAAASFVVLAALFVFGAPAAERLEKHRTTAAWGRLLRDLHRVMFAAGPTSAWIVVLAAAVQGLNVAALQLCALGMGVDLDARTAFVVVPAVMLVSLAPVSFAGWGVREGALIVGLGLAGIASADALAVSIAFGVLQALLGVPGGVLWLVRRAATA